MILMAIIASCGLVFRLLINLFRPVALFYLTSPFVEYLYEWMLLATSMSLVYIAIAVYHILKCDEKSTVSGSIKESHSS